jgi:hypothetical protein
VRSIINVTRHLSFLIKYYKLQLTSTRHGTGTIFGLLGYTLMTAFRIQGLSTSTRDNDLPLSL